MGLQTDGVKGFNRDALEKTWLKGDMQPPIFARFLSCWDVPGGYWNLAAHYSFIFAFWLKGGGREAKAVTAALHVSTGAGASLGTWCRVDSPFHFSHAMSTRQSYLYFSWMGLLSSMRFVLGPTPFDVEPIFFLFCSDQMTLNQFISYFITPFI